jgi:hypothetical protein
VGSNQIPQNCGRDYPQFTQQISQVITERILFARLIEAEDKLDLVSFANDI